MLNHLEREGERERLWSSLHEVYFLGEQISIFQLACGMFPNHPRELYNNVALSGPCGCSCISVFWQGQKDEGESFNVSAVFPPEWEHLSLQLGFKMISPYSNTVIAGVAVNGGGKVVEISRFVYCTCKHTSQHISYICCSPLFFKPSNPYFMFAFPLSPFYWLLCGLPLLWRLSLIFHDFFSSVFFPLSIVPPLATTFLFFFSPSCWDVAVSADWQYEGNNYLLSFFLC